MNRFDLADLFAGASAKQQVLVDHPGVATIAARRGQALVGRWNAVHQNLSRQHHVLGGARERAAAAGRLQVLQLLLLEVSHETLEIS